MMHFSGEAALGLYALHYLGRKETPAGVPEIARSVRMSPSSVARALRPLRRSGLVRAVRGRGFILTRPPGAIGVLEALDALNAAGDGCRMRYDRCVFRGSCPFMPLCRESFESERAALRSLTVADLIPRPPAMPDCLSRRRRAAL